MRTRHSVAVIVCLAIVSGSDAISLAQGTLAGIGVNEADFGRSVTYTMISGRLDLYPIRQAFKAAAPAGRAAFITTLVRWAQAYTQSAAFKADYAKQRAEDVPTPPAKKTVDGEVAKMKAERLKGIEEARKSAAQMPAEMRPQMEAVVKQMEADAVKQERDPQMAAMMRQAYEMQIAAEQEQYQKSVAAHEERFPADPNVLVARRLREFLDDSKDVDFGAKLVQAGRLQRFENPAYEAKPAEWKLYYRAGKDATGAFRTAVQAWLASIGNK